MSKFLVKIADIVSSKLTFGSSREAQQEGGTFLYHDNGAISLNLSNENVQKKITKHLEELSHIQIKNSKRN